MTSRLFFTLCCRKSEYSFEKQTDCKMKKPEGRVKEELDRGTLRPLIERPWDKYIAAGGNRTQRDSVGSPGRRSTEKLIKI
jgi:hypothetical protein